MSLDIEQTLKEMADAVINTVKNEAEAFKAQAKEMLDAEKDALKDLGEAKLKGDIDEETFEQEVAREKKVLEAELLTLEIMTKALALKAVNAAIDVFKKALAAAI